MQKNTHGTASLRDDLQLPEPVIVRNEFRRARRRSRKWERLANDIDGGIALVTPDDVGSLAHTGDALLPSERRARENVSIEAGWVWGRLGRERLLLVRQGDTEIPSDVRLGAFSPASSPRNARKRLSRAAIAGRARTANIVRQPGCHLEYCGGAASAMEPDRRVLPPDVFDFVLANELKRAVRAQTYLTLLLFDPAFPDHPGGDSGERDRLVRRFAEVIGREVRETDLLAQAPSGRLSLVLLDADFGNALRVVERIVGHLTYYRFPRPMDITVGAACCPTHGADADSLRRGAEARPIVHRRCGPAEKAPQEEDGG